MIDKVASRKKSVGLPDLKTGQMIATSHKTMDIAALESSLWEAADQLRANSKLTSSDYFMPVLGVIFLRHAANRFEVATKQIQDDQASGRIPRRNIIPADYLRRRALWLPEQARYDVIMERAAGSDLPKLLAEAMTAIEDAFDPLHGVLPKDYGIFESRVLEDLLRLFNSEQIKQATGDVFGRIYEYFLAKFSVQKAHDNGEFFTPSSIVQTIVNVIEPEHGIVFDPACGSGGMFVQSSYFIERAGGNTAKKVVFYGQEKNRDTIRLAKMNLAVHGLEGKITETITYYQDEHTLAGKCDFVMANPPFNVDLVDAERIKGDPRLPFGLPGVNKQKKVSNGNYLWISYFWSYLSERGRSGFVMSSQASSAGHGEKEVRRRIIETGDVDVMISIRSNFFYTRSVPCELWFFDKGKPQVRRDHVLMIDARSIYRKVTRKIYDFSPEQMQNLAAIVWLYRGQTDRFLVLVQSYIDRTLTEAAAISEAATAFRECYEALKDAAALFLKTLPKDSPLCELLKERDNAAKACFQTLDTWTARIAKDWKKSCERTHVAQNKLLAELNALAEACRDLIKDVDLVCKLSVRLMDAAEKDAGARKHDAWDSRLIGQLERELDAARVGFDEQQHDDSVIHRHGLVEQLTRTAYFQRQAHWLLSRFPDAQFVPVPGLCRVVTRAEIKAADWSLTPGRYVGVAPAEEDEDFDFEATLRDIHTELADLNQEAAALAGKIERNFEELAI